MNEQLGYGVLCDPDQAVCGADGIAITHEDDDAGACFASELGEGCKHSCTSKLSKHGVLMLDA